MKYCLIILNLLVLLFACKQDDLKNKVLSQSNLASLIVRIRPDRDTIIRTGKGAIIKISKGTFDKETDLEIKEAYSMSDMVLAGLVTETDSSLLSSGGMIYINSTDGTMLKLNKAVAIILPSDYIEEKMNIYKGGVENSNINWKALAPLDTVPDSKSIIAGKALFTRLCASCHRIFSMGTGPALENLRTRGPWSDEKEVFEYVRNPLDYERNKPYGKVVSMLTPTVMQVFPDITQREVNQILEFIEYEERKLKITGIYPNEQYIAPKLDTTSEVLISNRPLQNLPPDTINPNEALRSGFTDVVVSDFYYEFSIETLGWYNVDAEMIGLPGTELCELDVILENNTVDNMNIYLFVPSKKNLAVGSETAEKNTFHFMKYQGKIPLSLNEKAYILAFGNQKERFYYGISEFIIKKQQEVKVQVRQSTKDELLKAVKDKELDGINLEVNKPSK